MIHGSPRVLVVRLGSLGDVVPAMPAGAALRRRHPEARIDWAVDPRYAELVSHLTAVDRVVPVDPRGSRRALLAAVSTMRGERYDVAIDLQGLVKSAVLARAVRPRSVLGFPRAHLREPMARALYNDAPDPGSAVHVLHKNLALVRAVGVEDLRVEFPLRMPPTPVAEEVRQRWGSAGYALVNPGAAWPNKRWPADRFGALATLMRDRLGLSSLVLWGPGEEPLGRAVAASSGGAAEMLPATGIMDVLGIAQSARLMVSGDTGPLHLAGAVGTSLVAIFGPTRAERNGPWDAADITISRLDRCGCHYERRCRLATPCIDDVTVDEVIAAVERRLAARG
jgi:lipopolysaccharide heptosyltransferase I